jgi:Ribbon-helix-helix protein, copG family
MISWTQHEGAAVPRPRTGETPIRHVRIADKVWAEVERIAREEGRSVTSVVRDALARYLAWHKRQGSRSGE